MLWPHGHPPQWQHLPALCFAQAGEKHYHPSCALCVRCGQMFSEGEEMYLQGKHSDVPIARYTRGEKLPQCCWELAYHTLTVISSQPHCHRGCQ